MTETLPTIAMHSAKTDSDAVMCTDTQSTPPAVRVALVGEHLIEASAGTGKTWTLTGILLRLLIEAKRPPEQIIATTFTRAAAAEMRQRVNERLIDFYQVLQWLSSLQDNPNYKEHLYPDALQVLPDTADKNQTADKLHTKTDHKVPNLNPNERAALKAVRNDWLTEQAKLAGMSERVNDPINLHLLGYLLDNVTSYPLADAIRRTELVLTTLDKLFVGTLDSLAQKWLSEYSAETGYRQGMSITDDIDAVTDGIIHDELRRFQSQLYYNQPKIYQLLQEQGKLTTIDDHRKAVNKALTFISAPIDEVDKVNFSLGEYEEFLSEYCECNFIDIEPYLDIKHRKKEGFNNKKSLAKNLEFFKSFKHMIKSDGIMFYKNFTDPHKNFLKQLIETFNNSDGSGFNEGEEEGRLRFINLESVKMLKRLYEYTLNLESFLESFTTVLNRNIVMSVRKQLASILEERNETTFTLQMVRLNQALSGRQGHKLARYIRHHYPVALIDESQDINGEQAQMIERIYLPSKAAHNPTHKELVDSAIIHSSSDHANSGNTNTDSINTDDTNDDSKKEKKINTFLLLVGDPKQAIYGFRGGDVANYNYMKAKFKQMMTLNLNRRSNASLIDALNHWFGCPTSSLAQNADSETLELTATDKNSLSKNCNSSSASNSDALSELGENIHYHYIEAHNQQAKLSWQLAVNIPSKPMMTVADANRAELNEVGDAEGEGIASSIHDLLPSKPVTIIHLPKDENDYDESEATAYHIAALLKSHQTLNGQPIKPSDIGVLGRRKLELKQVEDLLLKLNVPTLSTSEVSIFETTMAADLVALMEAMLRSYRRDTINRALSSHLFGLSLRQVKAMMVSHDRNGGVDNDLTLGYGLADYANEDKQSQSYQDFITHIKEAAERWQKRGILPALHHLLGKSPIHPKGAWQSLAALADGERHIMDLRHLLDILAQYSMNMGEHELLSWYKQNMSTIPIGDWAKQQPLPTESGVQLMTIHKSKGLEFPIVYVLGMDAASNEAGGRDKNGLYLYNAHELNTSSDSQFDEVAQVTELQRQLSPVKGKVNDDKFFTDIESSENYSERKRLGYVAFTRASEQLYIVLKDLSKKTSLDRRPAFFWLSCQDKEFVLPDRLKAKVGWIAANKIFDYHQEQQASQVKLSLITQASSADIKKVTLIDYPDLDQLMPRKFFYGWAKTSFTALARQLSEQSQDLAIMDERIDDDIYIATTSRWDSANNTAYNSQFAALKSIDDIRFSFVKGANAGTFLHEIFEKIDFTGQALWSTVIDKAIRDYQLPISYASAAQQQRVIKYKEQSANNAADDASHQALITWIEEVLETPLLASNQALKSIPTHKRFAELSFNMGLSESFRAEGLNDIFLKYLPEEPDKHMVLTKHNIPHLYRYLRGEIDLVYEHAGKYYVVDYKSNYLGNSLSEYNEHTLSEAMSKAGYWLQAAIYQVALHRFLSIRIKDYVGNEEQYLGAVEYVFLRGTFAPPIDANDKVNGNTNNDASSLLPPQRFGLVKWDIPIDFIKALDNAFGKPTR